MKSVKVKLNGIKWDTDDEEVDLPTSMTVTVDSEDDTIIDMAIDAATDMTGWCIDSVQSGEIIS